MRIATRLYQRFQSLVHELAKFGVVGATGFVLNYAITNALRFGVDLGPLTSNVFATVATTTFAYFANRFWTFRHREQSGLGREYFLFFVFNGVGLLIQILCIGFAFYTLKLEGPVAFNAALTVGVIGGTLFRYWSYKKWVFLPPSLPPVDPHTGLPEAPHDAEAPHGDPVSHGDGTANGDQVSHGDRAANDNGVPHGDQVPRGDEAPREAITSPNGSTHGAREDAPPTTTGVNGAEEPNAMAVKDKASRNGSGPITRAH